MTSDTPRTDAELASTWQTERRLHELCQQLELELTHSLQNQVKTQAEVKSLTEKLTSLQTAYLASAERDNSLTKELFDSRAEIESLSKLTEDCLNVIRVYCPIYYNDAMDRFKTINKCTH